MVFIIAELGTNHMGDVKIIKKLIDVAVSAGCNAVKLQKRNVEKIFTKEFLDSLIESPWGTTQRDMRLHRELNDKQFRQINLHCKRKKIPWFVSCWDVESQIHMRKFRTKFNKVPSAMLVHEKLLHTIAEENKYTFISTGMSSLKDIEKAVKIFRKYHCSFELMHCHSAYPMPPEEANLKLIPFLRKKFRCKVGYSGHESAATYVSLPAVFLGATSIERHITLDRASYGTDQAASLEPKGLNTMIRDIRILEKIMGDGKKRVWKSEIPNLKKLRQILV
jgi:N-acetylneuraminate synthase